MRVPPSPHSSLHLGFCVSEVSHSNKCAMVVQCHFNLPFSRDTQGGASSHMLSCYLCIFFADVLRSLAHFLIGLFSSCRFSRVLYTFWSKGLYQMCLLQTFSLSLKLVCSFSWSFVVIVVNHKIDNAKLV